MANVPVVQVVEESSASPEWNTSGRCVREKVSAVVLRQSSHKKAHTAQFETLPVIYS